MERAQPLREQKDINSWRLIRFNELFKIGRSLRGSLLLLSPEDRSDCDRLVGPLNTPFGSCTALSLRRSGSCAADSGDLEISETA